MNNQNINYDQQNKFLSRFSYSAVILDINVPLNKHWNIAGHQTNKQLDNNIEHTSTETTVNDKRADKHHEQQTNAQTWRKKQLNKH